MVSYPENLRAMINSGQTRTINASFVEQRPIIGPSYIESITDDEPFVYDFNLSFTRFEAAVFFAWYNSESYCNKGRNEFTMPIRLDSGDTVEQTVRFTQNGVPQLVANNGGGVVYSCQVYGRTLEQAVDFDYILEFYEIYGNNPEELAYLDITVNEALPSA